MPSDGCVQEFNFSLMESEEGNDKLKIEILLMNVKVGPVLAKKLLWSLEDFPTEKLD